MASPRHSPGFTRAELLAVVAVLLAGCMLLPTWVLAEREQSRELVCANKLHRIGLAILGYSDKFGRFPACSSRREVWQSVPGREGFDSEPPDPPAGDFSGYSWMALILAHLEQATLNDTLVKTSQNFNVNRVRPWSIINRLPNGNHVSTFEIPEYRCPAYTGEKYSLYTRPQGEHYYRPDANPAYGPAISNYTALAATNIGAMAEPPDNDPEPRLMPYYKPNGVLTPGQGMLVKKVTDGLSKTFIAAETKESNFGSWFDGTTSWVVALDPNKVIYISSLDDQGRVPRDLPPSIQVGPALTNIHQMYLLRELWDKLFNSEIPANWQWGPSSDHPGGYVMHLLGDASIHKVTSGIQGGVYADLVTAAGGEKTRVEGP